MQHTRDPFFFTGYFDGDYNTDSNKIIFDVAVTMLDHVFNASHPYTLGFTLWSQGSDSIELMWSGQSTVQAEDGDLPELVCIIYNRFRLSAASVCTPFNDELMAMNNCVGLAYVQNS